MQHSAASKREHLISIPAVILLGVIIVILLLLLFPGKGTFEDSRYIKHPDQLSIAYLKTIFKLQPENIQLRLTLAQQYVAVSKWQEAKELIDGFTFHSAKDRAQADIISIQVYREKYAYTDKNDPSRYQALQQAQKILAQINLSQFKPEQLQQLAKIALSLNRPALATNIYQHLAQTSTHDTAKWWALAGKWARASAQNELARLYYLNAYLATENSEKATQYASLSVISTIEANQHQLAIQSLTEYLRAFPGNRYFLESIVSAYQTIGNLQKAAQWNSVLLSKHGQNNEKIIARQIKLELALSHLQHAKKYAYRLVLLKPENRQYRKQLAQLYEWTGHPIAAQKQWKILALTDKTFASINHVLRLAKMNYDDAATLAAFKIIERRRKLTDKEIFEKIAIYERQGKPVLAQTLLTRYLAKKPADKDKWLLLAKLYENQDDYEGAIKVWQKIERLFSPALYAKTQQIKLHWDYQKHKKAYLKAATLDPDFTKIKSLNQLQILVELGWRFKDNALLYKASKELVTRDKKNEAAYKWLLSIADENGDVDQAAQLGRTAWENTGKTVFLRLAINTAIKENNNRQTRYLIDLALQSKISSKELTDYLMIKAEIESKDRRFSSAAKYYEYALLLKPSRKYIHIGLLWSLLNSQQREKLKHYLIVFKGKAYQFSNYWPVYAASTYALGESRESVYWHAKFAALYPDNKLWLLRYADALESAGQDNSALKLRLYVIKQMRASNIYTVLSKKPVKQLTQYYLSLERNIGLSANTNNMIREIIGRNKNNIPYEFLVAWYSAKNMDEMSHYWHLSQQLSRKKISDNQLLLFALKENNTSELKNILARHSDISAVDRNEALIRLSQYETALAYSVAGIGLLSSQEERRVYRQQAASLMNILPNYWSTSIDRYSNGQLSISTIKTQLKTSINNWNYTWSLSNNVLNIDTSIVNLGGNDTEQEYTFRLMRPSRRFNFYSNLTYNQRSDKSITPLTLAVDYNVSKRANFKLAWEYNQLSEESSALRSLGMLDKLQFGVNANIGSREYMYTQIAKTKYQSRWSEALADGWSANLGIGHLLSTGRNRWAIQADASWIANKLENTLPFQLSQRLPTSTTTATVVAQEFGTLGISMRLNRGDINSSYPQTGSLGYFADIWLGKVYPNNDFAYRLSSGIASRVLGNDRLSFELYADQTKANVGNQTSWGITVSYRNYLGR